MRPTALVLLLVLMLAHPTGAAYADGSPRQQAGERTAVALAQPADARAIDEDIAIAAVDEFWRRYFAGIGQRYEAPRVVGGYVGTAGPRCGAQRAVAGNALYCPAGDFLAWDEALMEVGYERIGDAWVYLVIAHEWAHAIQVRLDRSQVSVAAELQADCLAGAALQGAADDGLVRLEPGDDEELRRSLVAAADDYPWTDVSSHGNAQQRIAAFTTGAGGGVNACV